MFDIVFGATLRVHITIIHPLLKYFNLEEGRSEGGRSMGGARGCRDRAIRAPLPWAGRAED